MRSLNAELPGLQNRAEPAPRTICKKPWIIPIPGSRKPERLRENLGSASVTLTADEVARIDAALDSMELAVFGGHQAK